MLFLALKADSLKDFLKLCWHYSTFKTLWIDNVQEEFTSFLLFRTDCIQQILPWAILLGISRLFIATSQPMSDVPNVISIPIDDKGGQLHKTTKFPGKISRVIWKRKSSSSPAAPPFWSAHLASVNIASCYLPGDWWIFPPLDGLTLGKEVVTPTF